MILTRFEPYAFQLYIFHLQIQTCVEIRTAEIASCLMRDSFNCSAA